MKIGIFKADQLQSCTDHIQVYPETDEDGRSKQFHPPKYSESTEKPACSTLSCCVVTQSLSVEWQSLSATSHPSLGIFEFLGELVFPRLVNCWNLRCVPEKRVF